MKKLLLIPFLFILFSCGKDAGPFNFDQVKTDLKLTPVQIGSFDQITKKYSEKRKAIMTGDGERETKLNLMQGIMQNQISDINTILNEHQKILFEPIAERFTKFGKPGYSQKFLTKLTTKLKTDSTQEQQIRFVNKAFEKAYINAHDYYHGKPEVAKEYWNKFDQERRKSIKAILTKEQYAQYLILAKDEVFKSEH